MRADEDLRLGGEGNMCFPKKPKHLHKSTTMLGLRVFPSAARISSPASSPTKTVREAAPATINTPASFCISSFSMF